MPDDQDPPRIFYQFKPREFERANPTAPGAAPEQVPANSPPGAPEPAAGPIDLRELIRQGAANAPLLSGNVVANRANEVHAMLVENNARADAAGLNNVVLPPKRRSRRKRDYWLMMIVGNAICGGIVLIVGLGNPVAFVSAIAGAGMLSAALTWVMWFVLDDY